MSSEKRQRQRENRMRATQQAEQAAKRSTTTRRVVKIALIVAAVLVTLLVWSWLTGNDDDTVVATQDDSELLSGEPGGDTADGTDTEPLAADQAGCPAEDGSDGPRSQLEAAPPICIDPDTLYAAAFDTNFGSFTLVLDPSLDLASVNNFIVLARWGAYDDTLFHRVISNFMIQGGDVQLLSGRGGPGYAFTGGFPEDGWYRLGSVAMANTGDPSSNGSQFFIITGDAGVGLPPLYSPMGQVVDGMNVVMAIEGVETTGTPTDNPLSDVELRSVRITEATDEQIAAFNEARR